MAGTLPHALDRAMRSDPQQRFAAVAELPAAPRPKATVLLWDDAYEPPVAHGRFVRRVALGVALVILLAGAVTSGLWLTRRSQKAPAAPGSARGPAAGAPLERSAIVLPAPLQQPAPPPPASSPPASVRRTRPAPVASVPGRLFVGATPWGELYIDGRLVGHTPMVGLPIAAGWHQVRIVRDGFAPYEQHVQVAPGGDVRLTGIVLHAP